MNLGLIWLMTLTIISAILVILALNPIHALLALVLVFLNVSLILIWLGIDFIGLILIIVYLGAVSVLFLFTLIMLNIKPNPLVQSAIGFLPIALLITGIFFLNLMLIFKQLNLASANLLETTSFKWVNQDWLTIVDPLLNINLIGSQIYWTFKDYLIFLSFILLLAMIAAILLSLNHQKLIFRQTLGNQIKMNQSTKFLD